MGMTAARHLRSVVANAEIVLALELLGAAQALDLRLGLRPGEGSRAARDAIRERVAFLEADRELRGDIDDVVELVRGAVLLERVEDAVGALN